MIPVIIRVRRNTRLCKEGISTAVPSPFALTTVLSGTSTASNMRWILAAEQVSGPGYQVTVDWLQVTQLATRNTRLVIHTLTESTNCRSKLPTATDCSHGEKCPAFGITLNWLPRMC